MWSLRSRSRLIAEQRNRIEDVRISAGIEIDQGQIRNLQETQLQLRIELGLQDESTFAEFLISDIQRLETELKSITESEIGRVTELMDHLGKGTHSGRMIRKPKRAYGFTRSDRMLPPSAKYA